MRILPPTIAIGLVAALAGAGAATGTELRDPHFGEALFHAHQGHYFEALERLDAEIAQHYRVDEPDLDSLYHHIDQAEFSVGDFELEYRMHHRAGRAIKAVLEADVPDPVRNEAAFRLARIHFHKGQNDEALRTLDRIEGGVDTSVRDEAALLRANVLMALGRPVEAVDVLRDVQGAEALTGFSTYNLGIALLRADEPKEAVRQLDRAGRVKGDARETRAIRDKANFVLGTLLLDSAEFDFAQRALDRVRLEGPFSTRALLGAGWADASAERFERAIVPWSILVERDTTDSAVQDGLLALPYAYSKLDVHGRAAVLYERAVDTFGRELEKVDASITSIRSGEFLAALVREEIRQDKDWVVRLRSLEGAPETFYLIGLLASHDFQTALQNYLDLEDLRKKLSAWRRGLDAFEDITRLRRAHYTPLLPAIDARFRKLDAQMRLRLEQRRHVRRRLEDMLTSPRPELLATSAEQALESRLAALDVRLEQAPESEREALRGRIERLRGLLTWSIETEYAQRLTDAHKHLRALDVDVEALEARYESFVRTRQAAVHSYVGYGAKMGDLRARVARSLERVDTLMSRQGHLLESVAIRELASRRERLLAYQNKARFAFADSYDRAVKAQARVR